MSFDTCFPASFSFLRSLFIILYSTFYIEALNILLAAFQLINSDEPIWACYRMARREEVEGNMEEVQLAITDEWAIVELEDGEISGTFSSFM